MNYFDVDYLANSDNVCDDSDDDSEDDGDVDC